MDDDGNDHRSDPVQEALSSGRTSVDLVSYREGKHDHRRRDDEARACHQQASPPGPLPADVDGELRGIRARYEVGCPVEVQELLVPHPPPARDHLLAHHRYMRRWSPERHEAELREEQEELPQLAVLGRGQVRPFRVLPRLITPPVLLSMPKASHYPAAPSAISRYDDSNR